MLRILGRPKRLLWTAAGVLVGVLATAGVSAAVSSRATGTTRTFVAFSAKKDAAGSKTLHVTDGFTITGNCIDIGAGVFRAQPVVTTSNDNAAFNSASGDATDQDFDIADGEKKIQSDANSAEGSSGTPEFDYLDDSHFSVIKSNGKVVIQGFVWSAAGHGAACRWGGQIVKYVEG